MRIPLMVPELGAGQTSIRLSGWLVDEGDFVLDGERVVELLLPGMTFEVSARSAGRLVELAKAIDCDLSVGDVLGWIDDGAEVPTDESDPH